MYVVLSSQDNINLYEDNTWLNFTVELPQTIEFASAKYQVALTHVYSLNIKSDLYFVFSSICLPSVVASKERDFLGQFFEDGSIGNPHYLDIAQENIQRITFSVFNKNLEKPEPKKKNSALYFTLHFREKDV